MPISSEATRIRAVILAYCQVIRELYGARITPTVPENGDSKHYKNCLAFYDLAESCGVSIHSLMLATLDWFPSWWCQKVFKRDYPSVMILASEKSRNRGAGCFPETVKGRPDKAAEFYFKQLKALSQSTAKGLLSKGFVGQELIEPVSELLEKEWSEHEPAG